MKENIRAVLFGFSFNMMLSYQEAISFINERIETGYIDKKKLSEEFYEIGNDDSINWIELVVEFELITINQALEIGQQKCKEYVFEILNNFILTDYNGH